MAGADETQVLNALKAVIDPDLGMDIVTLGFVQDVRIDHGKVSFRLVLTTPACPMKNKMKSEAEEALLALDGVDKVEITLDARTRTSREADDSLLDVKHVILVGSGKGGVGKSTVAVNLAAALHKMGASVGILDADIYGPSVPVMLNLSGPPAVENKKMVPLVAYGMPVISIGFLAREEDALIWRGPILHQVLTQFVKDVKWGHLDYLIIDLPPGTGDVQISLAQLVRASGALMVTTPQDISFRDVRRAAVMFEKVNVPILGIVENMSHFICPDCGRKTDIFPSSDEGSLRQITPGFMVPVLERFAINPHIAATSEKGEPIVLAESEGETAKQFISLAGKIAQQLSKLAMAPAARCSEGISTNQD